MIAVAADMPEEQPEAPRVGLVLGAGGAVGAAYHAGALAALEHDLGWDARRAAVVLGTSAGSLVGALLRRGVPSTDLAALTVGADAQYASPHIVESFRERLPFRPMGIRDLIGSPNLPSLAAVVGIAKLTAKQRAVPFSSLSMLLPEGREDLAPQLAFLDVVGDHRWPDETLLISAVRRRDWRRTIFGSTRPTPPLSAALAASCAVPGYFAGVKIGGDTYLDGGAISATNADVLAHHDVDLVIVISPMTGAARWPSASQLVRRLCRRTLDQELRALRRRGIPAVVIEPGADVLRHMSMQFMSEEASIEIVQSAFLDTGAQIARNPVLAALAGLQRRRIAFAS